MVVLGPTASGKTKIACTLAHRLNGEVISVDSRQVYRELDIGTGKDLDEYLVEGKQIPYHLININDVVDQFYLHDFIREAERAFLKIKANGHLPIFCGGTGLYLDALQKDLSLTQIPEQPELRSQLETLEKSELLARLEKYPGKNTAMVDRSSKKRIIRGIEIAEHYHHHGDTITKKEILYDPLYIGISQEREKLKQGIAARLEKRLKAGLIREVQEQLSKGVSHERLEQLGLEYKFVSKHIRGEISENNMKERLQTAIFQFSKRQMTWFRKMEREGINIHWIDPAAETDELVSFIKNKLND